MALFWAETGPENKNAAASTKTVIQRFIDLPLLMMAGPADRQGGWPDAALAAPDTVVP
jgi:hypothetical protein